MFKDLIKGLLAGVAIKLIDRYREWSIQLLRIEAAMIYLQGVQLARLSVIGLMGMGMIITLIGVGVVLVHVGFFILLPWTLTCKALFGVVLGVFYIVGGILALRTILNERLWMNKSGATRMLNNALGQSGFNPRR